MSDLRLWRGVTTRMTGSSFAWVASTHFIKGVRALEKQIIDAWKKEAAKSIRNPQMLARFQAAMRASSKHTPTGMLISLELDGMWGQAIERGWAPVGPKFADGYGEYDGAVHDMRRFLLGDGKPFRVILITQSMSSKTPKYGDTSPLTYLIGKMQQAQRASSSSKTAKYFRRPTKPPSTPQGEAWRQARVRTILETAAADPHPPSLDEASPLSLPKSIDKPATRRIPGDKNAQHVASMLRNAVASRAPQSSGHNGTTLSTFRTVTKSSNPTTWRTRGIPPANTFDKIGPIAAEMLREAFTPR